MTTTREAAKTTEAEITPARQKLIDLKATMPMRDDLTCAMFAAWLNVSVDKLPGEFKQFDNPETMMAWRRVADAARAALDTPATEPQGCAAALAAIAALPYNGNEAGHEEAYRAVEALAARPAPQTAADTRLVPLDTLMRWQAVLLCSGVTIAEMIGRDVKAIIGTATPAQSDKIAEAARDCRPENYASGVQCRTCGQSWGEDGPEQCPDAALAEQGE